MGLHLHKYSLCDPSKILAVLMLKSATSVLKIKTDFRIFHRKAALENDACALFCTLIILRKKKVKCERKS